ncbi:winged helix-turn-helix transcriptional regulator [Nocardiopsis alborubida]|uniref:Helix-turn-helix transcriptional regulator n=1 Tax=Nocardiopsis alborubida TaxID=146802 RepID=A0A7X6RR39_9ACTN|nr:helix-turn-helix domain-containing protein [Nocardiopsis alborubida]NKY99550.1 helix-turn-helix transcriptional regulator [Nocardiopsis alborubida]
MSVPSGSPPPPRGQVLSADCPSRRLLAGITSKWGVLVLVSLSRGPLRWSELLRTIGGISEKMLAQTLRTFEADGLVLRDARPVVPPYVEYRLTEDGREVTDLLLPMVEWVQDHVGDGPGPSPAEGPAEPRP